MQLVTDLEIAERVIRSMIPSHQRRGDLEILCDFAPMNKVGGDYASVHFQDDRHVVAGICDVSGHGIAAALLASRVNSFVINTAPSVQHPCEVVLEGLGFVVTINTAKQLLALEDRVWMGIEGFFLDQEQLSSLLNLDLDGGLLIQRIAKGSPADNAGLRAGSVPAQISGQKRTPRFPSKRGFENLTASMTARSWPNSSRPMLPLIPATVAGRFSTQRVR